MGRQGDRAPQPDDDRLYGAVTAVRSAENPPHVPSGSRALIRTR